MVGHFEKFMLGLATLEVEASADGAKHFCAMVLASFDWRGDGGNERVLDQLAASRARGRDRCDFRSDARYAVEFRGDDPV